MTTATIPQFKGFAAKIDGRPVYVINEGVNTAGEPIYKVRLGSYSGYHGWSGGARRDISYTGRYMWVKKEKVTR